MEEKGKIKYNGEMETKEKDVEEIISLLEDDSEEEKKLVKKAFEFSKNAHDGQKRLSGEPYFNHSFETAKNIAELGMSATTIAAGFLHDLVEDADILPEEQKVLFQDIILHKMNVRDAELAARRIAIERVRKINASIDPEICALEEKFTESLGTRVRIEKKEKGGKLMIEFFSNDDLEDILNMLKNGSGAGIPEAEPLQSNIDDRTPEEIKVAENTEIDTDLYSIKNFSL